MSSVDPHLGQRPGRQYSFGEFTLDLDRGVLRRSSEEVPLRPKSFEALTYLVEHHGHLVAKSALIDAVWPDTAVGDNSLAQCLFDIRRALGDDSQQIIRTVARRGYIFTPPVARASNSGRALLMTGVMDCFLGLHERLVSRWRALSRPSPEPT